MFRKHFVIVSDDSTFLADISKCDAQHRAHFGKEMAELVQNDTEMIDWNFVLFMQDNVYLPKVVLNVFKIEPLRFFHSWVYI
jgi:hypothetical protein